MNKILSVIFAVIVLAGCQSKEEAPTTTTNIDSFPAISAERKDAAKKLTAQAMVFLSQSKFGESIASLDAAIKFDPTNPDAYLILGQILLKSGEFERAAAFLEIAAKNFPNNGTIYYMFSVANQMTGRKLPAVLAARRSFEIFKELSDQENAQKSAVLLQQLINMPDTPPADTDQNAAAK